MSRLIAIIDEYKDRHGQPSDSSIARAIGLSPQAISSWRKRGIKSPPERDALRKLAALAGVDYEGVVLRAVLLDVGWIDDPEEGEQDERDEQVPTI
jgi:transcriptional regulator with XRE-family HTH domain